MSKINWVTKAFAAFFLCATAAITLPAQTTGSSAPSITFTTLHSFDGTDGYIASGLVQGADGNFYGTTQFGGTGDSFFECLIEGGCGTVFKITPNGKLTTLYNFCSQGVGSCADGSYPLGGLLQATNGDFYGTVSDGGATGGGTVFKITSSGKLATLYNFCLQTNFAVCPHGSHPGALLLQDTHGDFYGIASAVIFKITPSGMLTTFYNFNGTDLTFPSGLVQATNGKFYGTAAGGGANGAGAFFQITANGKLTILYSFCSQANCTDGSDPSGLVQGTDGNFYGTTYAGGAYNDCMTGGCGTVFRITPTGKLTTLHSFDATDGGNPGAALIQATDGKFYGTTPETPIEGANAAGSIFKITPSGRLTTLYSFCSQSNCVDGAGPSGLVQGADGSFYGTTFGGGANGFGTVFRLSVGLGRSAGK